MFLMGPNHSLKFETNPRRQGNPVYMYMKLIYLQSIYKRCQIWNNITNCYKYKYKHK